MLIFSVYLINSRMKNIIEAYYALMILLSPILGFSILGFIASYYLQSDFGNFLMYAFPAVGFGIGVIWLNRISKKSTFSHFYSRVNASPDLDVVSKKSR